ncbi:hypothetical protein Bbelb_071500 [Branchiostoma belcheri]|nr:hypothetical protein Bbelb_071500 [Branchiostoma belcheri]
MSSSNPANVKHTARSRRSQTSGKHSESHTELGFKPRSQPAVRASACALYVHKRGQTQGIRACTYNSLTTCATNDARNRSRPDVACRPHSYTLRNRASDVRRRHSFPTASQTPSGLPRSGNLHQRAKGFCGPANEFWLPGYMYKMYEERERPPPDAPLSFGHNPPYVLLRAVYVQKRGQTHVGWRSGTSFDCEPETRVRFRVVPGTCLDMRPTFLTPPRCEWVPNFGWGKSY